MTTTPPPVSAPPAAVDVWERWLPAWHVFNLGVLGLTTAIAIVDDRLAGSDLATVGAIVGGLAVLYWWTWIRRNLWRQPAWLRGVYVVALLAGYFALLRISHSFAFLQASLYAQVFFCLPTRWAIVGGLSIGLIAATDTWLDAGGDLAVAGPEMALELASAVAFTMLSAWIGAIIEQSAQRQSLLDQLAATRAELATVERAAGVADERARLSREIHDTLAQGFASVVTHLEAADAVLAAEPERARGHVRAASDVARASLDEARGLVWALRPATLQDGGLPAALGRVAGGSDVELAISGVARPLHPEVEVTLLRAAQEAIANARRHARAAHVAVTLTYFDDAVSLDVIDDGVGFDPAAVAAPGPTGGHGLRGMRERAERLAGRLEVESAPGEGTAIALSLPAVTP